jgi:hypothetical protein
MHANVWLESNGRDHLEDIKNRQKDNIKGDLKKQL